MQNLDPQQSPLYEIPFAIVEVEVWELSIAAFGQFVATIGPPLGIGTLVLEDGSTVQGFLCESYGVAGAIDISDLGSWRAYRSRF